MFRVVSSLCGGGAGWYETINELSTLKFWYCSLWGATGYDTIPLPYICRVLSSFWVKEVIIRWIILTAATNERMETWLVLRRFCTRHHHLQWLRHGHHVTPWIRQAQPNPISRWNPDHRKDSCCGHRWKDNIAVHECEHTPCTHTHYTCVITSE